jgi:hypothetical protein
MLLTPRGRLIALSTPFGRRGFFFEAWTGPEDWHRVKVSASDCPRTSKEFLVYHHHCWRGRVAAHGNGTASANACGWFPE